MAKPQITALPVNNWSEEKTVDLGSADASTIAVGAATGYVYGLYPDADLKRLYLAVYTTGLGALLRTVLLDSNFYAAQGGIVVLGNALLVFTATSSASGTERTRMHRLTLDGQLVATKTIAAKITEDWIAA